MIFQIYVVHSFCWIVDVLKEFASKKCGKLGKLLKERGNHGVQMNHRNSSKAPNPSPSSKSDFGHIKVNKVVRVSFTTLLLIGFSSSRN